MSFNFTWPDFSPEFHADARMMLDSALNRGPKPKVIADDIKVDELSMGSVPPDLEILEIGDLSRDRFRGIFRLTYSGDAHLVLSTKVQANPLTKPTPTSASSNLGQDDDTFTPFSSAGSSSRGILFAAAPLIVPMKLRLSHVRLRAIIVLVVSKAKGITLVFKNDPLESVQVSSTFDSVAVIAKYLQQEIESQLKEVFREDLPGIIHRLSQKWLNGQSKRGQAAAAGQKPERGPPQPSSSASYEALHALGPSQPPKSPRRTRKKSQNGRRASSVGQRDLSRSPPESNRRKGPRASLSKPVHPPLTSSQSTSAIPLRRRSSLLPPQDIQDEDRSVEIPPPLSASFDDAENYDPTYGLRPDEVRLPKDGKGFRGLKGLKRGRGTHGGINSMGLGDLLSDAQLQTELPSDTAELYDGQDAGTPDAGRSEWMGEDDMDEPEMQNHLDLEHHERDGGYQREPSSLLSQIDHEATRQEQIDAIDDVPDVPLEDNDSSFPSSPSQEEDVDDALSQSSPSPPHVARSNLDSAIDDLYQDSPIDGLDRFDELSPSPPPPTIDSYKDKRYGKGSAASQPHPSARPKGARKSSQLGSVTGKSNGSSHSVDSFKAGSSSIRVGAGVGLSGSDVGYGFMPASASKRAASVLGSGLGTSSRQVDSLSSSRDSSGRKPDTIPTSVSLSELSLGKPTQLTRSQSGGLQSSRNFPSRPPAIRPRIFHSSSLLRPVDPSVYGGESIDESLDDSNPTYPASNWTGSLRGGMADSVGEGTSTIYGGGGGGGGGSGSRSGPGSSRTFTIRRKNGSSTITTARSIGSGAGSVDGTAVSDSEGRHRQLAAKGLMARSSSSLSTLVRQRGWDWGEEAGEGSIEDSNPALNDAYDDVQRSPSHALPTSSSTSSLDDPPISSTSHSHSDSLSGSRAGTLSTLEPEPIDESSAVFRRQLEREKLGGLVRVGWEGVDSSHPSKGQSCTGGGGQAARGQPRRSGASSSPFVTPKRIPALLAENRHTNRTTTGTGTGTGTGQSDDVAPHPRYLDVQELVASNQTLSPYTRLSDTRGWAVRSMPATPGGSSGSGLASGLTSAAGGGGGVLNGWKEAVQDVDARRRRTFNLGVG